MRNQSVGTPQGGLISPILANVYLHYVLDLWFEKCIQETIIWRSLPRKICRRFLDNVSI